MTSRQLREWYAIYNADYYHNRLPVNALVRFVSLPKGVSGETAVDIHGCRWSWAGKKRKHRIRIKDVDEIVATIRVNKKLKEFERECRSVLHHEMVHIAMLMEDQRHRHGPKFEKRMFRIARLGGMEGVW